MEKLFSNINLSFADYLLVAIILTLFHIVNVMEILSLKNEKQDPYYAADLRFLSGISFTGIVCTIICGIVAQNLSGIGDTLLMLIPILFIFFWTYNQRRFSKLLDYEKIDLRINEEIKAHLTIYAASFPNGFDIHQLENDFKVFIIANQIFSKVKLTVSKKKSIPYFLVKDVFERLEFNEQRINTILLELCEERSLSYKNGLYFP